MLIEIGLDEKVLELARKCSRQLVEVARLLEEANEMHRQAKELNLSARRQLLENAKLLRSTLGGIDTLHIVDEGEVEKDEQCQTCDSLTDPTAT